MKRSKFSENLREALTVHKMTQQDLANRIGTTQQTVSRWLKGIDEFVDRLLKLFIHILNQFS